MGSGRRGALIATDELRAVLTLRLLPGRGDRAAVRLLRAQRTARAALALSPDAFARAAGPGPERARRDPELVRSVDEVLKGCESREIRIVPFGSPDYPTALLALSDPPLVLFLRGQGGGPGDRGVAIVGSRRATPIGRRAAERLARELSTAGVTIISGMALGIDGAAHRGALAGAGGTVAILGAGPDRPYPRGNRELFDRVAENGLLVSEFPPGEPARPFHFPRRNRIIAGLAKAVVVVEAARRSGALITVDHALDLGRDIFAVPGSVESPQSEGTNALIRDGAHPLVRGEELLAAMGWDLPLAPNVRSRRPSSDRTCDPGNGRPHPIESALGSAPRALDELVDDVGMTPGQVLAALTRLELQGGARRTSEGWIATR